ncbi:MAG: hypothetical protein ACXAB2_03940, partial [Candidatus Hodarchaeales archaeon]
MFKQAKWNEPLIFEQSTVGRIAFQPDKVDEKMKISLQSALSRISKSVIRETALKLPEVSELEVVRHYTRLSQMNYGVDTGFYPLGSCTMKYNPKICDT